MSVVASSVAGILAKAGVGGFELGEEGDTLGVPAMSADHPNQFLIGRYPTIAEQFGCPLETARDQSGTFRPVNFNEDFFAGVIGEEGPTVFLADESRFYRYSQESGIYLPTSREQLAATCSRVMFQVVKECSESPGIKKLEFAFRKSNRVNGVVERARGLLGVPMDYFEQEVGRLLAVRNGVLQLSDRTLLPFDPNHRLRRTLAVAYDQHARCPGFIEVLLRPALSDDDIELFQQWFGLAILGQNLAQVILLFIGTSGGGKGTIVRILNHLLGPANVVSLRVRQLEERFELGRMYGRSLVYGADVPAGFLNTPGAGVLKAITGGDPVVVEFKNSNARTEMQLRLNVLITANVRLRVRLEGGQDAAAWRRRLRIIQFCKPPTASPDPNLSQRLFSEEGPGILNFALDGLEKLRAQGYNLHLNPRQQTLVDDLLTESDSIFNFAQDCLRCGGQHQTITVSECYSEYLAYCGARGWNAVARSDFGSKLPPLVTQLLSKAVRNDIVGANDKQQHGFREVVCQRPRPANL